MCLIFPKRHTVAGWSRALIAFSTCSLDIGDSSVISYHQTGENAKYIFWAEFQATPSLSSSENKFRRRAQRVPFRSTNPKVHYVVRQMPYFFRK